MVKKRAAITKENSQMPTAGLKVTKKTIRKTVKKPTPV